MQNNAAHQLILMAAGSGSRYGLQKQFIEVASLPLFFHAILRFCPQVNFSNIVVVVPQNMVTIFSGCLEKWFYSAEKLLEEKLSSNSLLAAKNWLGGIKGKIFAAAGGKERWESAMCGLFFLNDLLSANNRQRAIVWVHDAARALICKDDVRAMQVAIKSCAMFSSHVGLLPAKKITDTIKKVTSEIATSELSSSPQTLQIISNENRELFVTVSTPQIFPFVPLFNSYKKLQEVLVKFGGQENSDWQKNSKNRASKAAKIEPNEKILHQLFLENKITDDAAVYLAMGNKVQAVLLCCNNPKLTFLEDGAQFFKKLQEKKLFS